MILETVTLDVVYYVWKWLRVKSYGTPLPNLPSTPLFRAPTIMLGPCEAFPLLRTELRIYRLASVLRLFDLRDLAMRRLYERPICFDDPLVLLADMYNRRPDEALRTWAREFIAVPSNAAVLVGREKFMEAVGKGGMFAVDVTRALAERVDSVEKRGLFGREIFGQTGEESRSGMTFIDVKGGTWLRTR
jgi:hypothetical protein